MTKDKKGFIHLTPKPGGPYDKFVRKRKGIKKKIPKDPDKFIEQEAAVNGIDGLINYNIGDYVHEKGVNHALNMNVGRNIPWIEDGLKSVERRVLYTMYDMGLTGNRYDKVAAITGQMMKTVYPHGDMAAADTVYRLGRSFSAMIPYVEAGGNFGNMYDMRPASPRYADATLSKYAMDCFFDEIGTINPLYDTKDNYKYDGVEPIYLTSRYPNVLMQWNQGIGKGAASWVGAFNSSDIFKTAIAMLDDPDVKVNIYPDCPTTVDIVNKKELKNCFDKSNFKVSMRGKYTVEVDKRRDSSGRIQDKYTIVFTSCPIGTKGQSIRDEIIKIHEEDAKKPEKRLPEVLNVECAADDTLGGIRLIVEYAKGYDPNVLAEKLFRSTSLGRTIGVNYNMVTENHPCLYTPREIMKAWIAQRLDQKRRYYHQKVLDAAKERARLSAICLIISDSKNLDKAIKLIRGSKNDAEAVQALIKAFDFTEFQARVVIMMRLNTLSKLNLDDQIKKRDQALVDYKTYRKILTEKDAIRSIIRDELKDGLKKYGQDRRATLRNLNTDDLEEGSTEKTLVYNDRVYYCLKSDDELSKIAKDIDGTFNIIKIRNDDTVGVFSSNGMIKILDGHAFRYNDTGVDLVNISFPIVAQIIPIRKNVPYLALFTKNGYGKLIDADECTKFIKGKVIVLNQGDELRCVIPVPDAQNGIVTLIDNNTMYYFKTESIPVFKRTSAGNRMIKGVDNLDLTNGVYLSDTDKYMFIYGESGYVKVLDTVYMSFAKRGNNCVSMTGKKIYDIVPLSSNKSKLHLYDKAGAIDIDILVDKNIEFVASTGEKQKFKMSTSIGNPVKVLKKAKNEFYRIK